MKITTWSSEGTFHWHRQIQNGWTKIEENQILKIYMY